MQTAVLKIETPATFQRALEAASAILTRGGLVAIPTETVYGLAANAFDAAAVKSIFEVKGRPAINPLIVHVASLAMARECVREFPETAKRLASRFWPGPLTLVLPKADLIPDAVTAGGDTVGIRWPLHPFTRELIEHCGFPLAAPSANLSNQLSPSDAEHVRRALEGRIELIVDAGPASVGIESTVADLTTDPIRVLRPGMISRAELEAALGAKVIEASPDPGRLKSPGLMAKHYAPRAALQIAEWNSDAALMDLARASGVPAGRVHVIAHDHIPRANPFGRVAIIPHDPEAYARALYAELHRCDELKAELILVENVPAGGLWDGIRDRLRRASAA